MWSYYHELTKAKIHELWYLGNQFKSKCPQLCSTQRRSAVTAPSSGLVSVCRARLLLYTFHFLPLLVLKFLGKPLVTLRHLWPPAPGQQSVYLGAPKLPLLHSATSQLLPTPGGSSKVHPAKVLITRLWSRTEASYEANQDCPSVIYNQKRNHLFAKIKLRFEWLFEEVE